MKSASNECTSSQTESNPTGHPARFSPRAAAGGAGPAASQPVCDYSIPESCAAAWPAIQAAGRAPAAAFITDCLNQTWALTRFKASDPAHRRGQLTSFFKKLNNRAIRIKPKDPRAEAKRSRILSALGPAREWLRKNSTHSKGAYATKSFGFTRPMMQEMMTIPAFIEAITDKNTREIPSLDYIERTFREAGHKVDARNECEDFISKTIGTRPDYRGSVIMADWTGLPLKIKGTAIEWNDEKTGKRRKRFQKFGAHLAVDAATNYTWIDQTYGNNELATWPGFLRWLLLNQLQYAPDYLVMDQVSGVIASLLHMTDETGFTKIMPEVLLWIAAGTALHVHTPERANAKGNVEVAAKLIKHRELQAVSVRKCLEKHMAGNLVKPRDGVTHSEVHVMMKEMARRANERLITRDGATLGQRNELWQDAEDAAKRNDRALVTDASTIWKEIVSRSKCVQANGKTLTLRLNGVRYTAELDGFERAGCAAPKDALAVIVPCGLRQGDDTEQYRVCVVQQNERGGLPKFHALTARAVAKDRNGFDMNRPLFGEGYAAKPDTNADETKKRIDAIGNTWPSIVKGKIIAANARKEATNDTVYE